MFKITEKFVKNIEKLKNYLIIRQEKDHLIIAVKLNIEKTEERMGSVFQLPHTVTVVKSVPIFFLLTTTKKAEPLDKFFIEKKLPFISFNKQKDNISSNGIKKILDDFVEQTFC